MVKRRNVKHYVVKGPSSRARKRTIDLQSAQSHTKKADPKESIKKVPINKIKGDIVKDISSTLNLSRRGLRTAGRLTVATSRTTKQHRIAYSKTALNKLITELKQLHHTVKKGGKKIDLWEIKVRVERIITAVKANVETINAQKKA